MTDPDPQEELINILAGVLAVAQRRGFTLHGQAQAALKAHAEWLREPKPADAEVWRCPTCDTIIDRQVMAGAAQQEDQHHD